MKEGSNGHGMPMGSLGKSDFSLLLGYASVGALAGFLTGRARNVAIGAAVGVLLGGVFQFLETVGRDSGTTVSEERN
jgi:hypothetical protein